MKLPTALSPRARRAQVTDEPFAVEPTLVGMPLGTVRRRAVAIVVDVVLAAAVGLPVILAVSYLALRVQAPEFAHLAMSVVFQPESSDVDREAANVQLMKLIQRRRPDLLPSAVATAIATGDAAQINAATEGLRLNFNPGSSDPSRFDPANNRLTVRGDVLFGPAASVASLLGFGVLYFTLLTWLGRGKTPGKFVCGMRVRRLDGKPLTLGTAFDRAGGYAASVSTAGLGFLRAVRDPNRQTLHDRLAATVVVRERPPGSIRARWFRAPFGRRPQQD